MVSSSHELGLELKFLDCEFGKKRKLDFRKIWRVKFDDGCLENSESFLFEYY